MAHLWIKFPQTNSEVTKAKEDWQKKFKIPSVIGAIDCTHVRISKPSINGDEYVNRKNYTSLNVQATCNANEEFTSIDAKWPGSVHDSRILRNSGLPQIMQTIPDTILLGDSGYGITPWLITPYSQPANDTERYFNTIYAKERVIIERCFGQLKRRFPILHYKVRTSLPTVPSIIISCAVLHNCSKFLKEAEDFPDLEDENARLENEGELDGSAARMRQLGQQKRNQIAATLFQNRRN